MSLTKDVTTAPNAAPRITATARSTTLPRSRNSRNSLIMSVPPGGYARAADDQRARPLPGRDPQGIAQQVHLGRGAGRHQARPLPLLLGGLSHRLWLHSADLLAEGNAAGRDGLRLGADLPGLRDPRPRDRRVPHQGRGRAGRQAALRAVRGPELELHGDA